MNFKRIVLQVADSTNKVVHEMYMNNAVRKPVCVTAAFQTAGKGLEQNMWFSSDGKNLLLSLGFKPDFLRPEEQFELTKIVSLALLETVGQFLENEKLFIKWPNDIYCRDQKIAGILISNLIQGREIELTIVGIGLNINEQNFPQSIPNPVSMIQLLGEVVKVEDVLDVFLVVFASKINEFRFSREKIHEDYLTNLLYYNEKRNYLVSKDQISGTITGVNAYGHLRLKTDDGDVMEFDLKEIVFIH
ncbi:MAG TPA: biotin--[acetyl-CoA-carboxylase] ligase [Bacteroidales bacterium]|nr:biotin--[acetyl-CoA-carboxylase] ligase [Bacteroidales bacterium]HQQ11825.1 biotin--[acetyl-CoA-carboxylase] ligase [Bacteroidales bacterium]